jgi:hypothetical protein
MKNLYCRELSMASPFRGPIVSVLAFATLAVGVSAAEAQSQQYPPPHRHAAKNAAVTPARKLTPAEQVSDEANTTSDIFVRKSGRNYYDGSWVPVGTTNRYFSDTKQAYWPSLGPSFTAYTGGYENLPSAREPFWPGF